MGPLCVHPQPWAGTQALLCELTRPWVRSSGPAPQSRGSWASQALHGLFLKPLPLAWLPAPCLAPSLKPGACGLAVRPLLRRRTWGHRALGSPRLSALSPLHEPPFLPLGGLAAVLQAGQLKVGAGESCGPEARLPWSPLQSLGRWVHRALPGRGGASSCSLLSGAPALRQTSARTLGTVSSAEPLPGAPFPFWQVSAALLSVV